MDAARDVSHKNSKNEEEKKEPPVNQSNTKVQIDSKPKESNIEEEETKEQRK